MLFRSLWGLMKRIAVFSDSHGNLSLLEKGLLAIGPFQVDEVLHLGDDYQDANLVLDHGYALTRVPGTWTVEYQDKYIDNRLYMNVEGWRLFLTHTPLSHNMDRLDDKAPENVLADGLCDVFLHGHTHQPTICKRGHTVMVNPGHVKNWEDRGYPATFCILSFTGVRLQVSIYLLKDGSLYLEEQFLKED